MNIDWGAVIAVALYLPLLFWPALRALLRGRWRVAAAFAVAGPVLVIGTQNLTQDWWEASHPDQEWSMSAPDWLSIAVSPVATVPVWLIGTWAINILAGWNAPRAKSPTPAP